MNPHKIQKKTSKWAQDILTIMSGSTFSEKGQYERKLKDLVETYLDTAFAEGFNAGLKTKIGK